MDRIVFALYDGFDLQDVSCAIAPFELCAHTGRRDYKFHYAARVAGPVRSGSGALLVCEPLPRPDGRFTLVLPGSLSGHESNPDPEMISWIERAVRAGSRVMALGSGVRDLALTGLLDGKRAVCHSYVAKQFSAEFPSVRWDSQHLYMRYSNIWTSAGVSTATDLALAVVKADCGSAVVREIARSMRMSAHRAGEHRQSSLALKFVTRSSRLEDLLTWISERLDEPLPIARLAEQVAMSPRHFTRVFAAEFGCPPAKVIEKLRVDLARNAMLGNQPLEQVARLAGFGDVVRMRRSFRRVLGVSPRGYLSSSETDISQGDYRSRPGAGLTARLPMCDRSHEFAMSDIRLFLS